MVYRVRSKYINYDARPNSVGGLVGSALALFGYAKLIDNDGTELEDWTMNTPNGKTYVLDDPIGVHVRAIISDGTEKNFIQVVEEKTPLQNLNQGVVRYVPNVKRKEKKHECP